MNLYVILLSTSSTSPYVLPFDIIFELVLRLVVDDY